MQGYRDELTRQYMVEKVVGEKYRCGRQQEYGRARCWHHWRLLDCGHLATAYVRWRIVGASFLVPWRKYEVAESGMEGMGAIHLSPDRRKISI